MAKKPEDIIRDEVRALAGYHVPESAGMVKLDAMENPYGLPEDVRGQIAALVGHADINRYPDASASRLKVRLRGALKIPDESAVLLGNGSDEILGADDRQWCWGAASAGLGYWAPRFLPFRGSRRQQRLTSPLPSP